jgi:chromosome segregation ATPase
LQVTDNSLIVSGLDHLLDELRNTALRLQEASQTCRRLKRERSRLVAESQKALSEMSEQISDVQQGYELLAAQKDDEDAQLRKMSHRTRKQEEEIAELKNELTSQTKTHGNELEDLMNQHQKVVDNLQFQYQTSVAEERAKFDQLTRQHEKLSQFTCVLKKAVLSLKDRLKKSDDAQAQLQREKSQLAESFDERLRSAKSANDQVVGQLRGQLAELRESLAQASERAQAAEAKNKKVTRDNGQLRRGVSRLEAQLAGDAEAAARDRKLAEAQTKSQEVNIQSRIQAALAAAKAEGEREKRRMIGLFVDEFRSLFDPGEHMDVATFERLLKVARGEMEKLKEELAGFRRLVSASPAR